MESQLQNGSQKAMQYQEQRVQLEEVVAKLSQSVKEMRNTLEKYSASIQVTLHKAEEFQELLQLVKRSEFWIVKILHKNVW